MVFIFRDFKLHLERPCTVQLYLSSSPCNLQCGGRGFVAVCELVDGFVEPLRDEGLGFAKI